PPQVLLEPSEWQPDADARLLVITPFESGLQSSRDDALYLFAVRSLDDATSSRNHGVRCIWLLTGWNSLQRLSRFTIFRAGQWVHSCLVSFFSAHRSCFLMGGGHDLLPQTQCRDKREWEPRSGHARFQPEGM